MISGFRRMGWWILLVCAWIAAAALHGTESATTARDTLAYKDGDRVQGKLVERTADTLVFKSDRFGELRVPIAGAGVTPGDKPSEPPAKVVVANGIQPPKATARAAAERAEAERISVWDRFSPSVLTAKVRNFFG